MMSNKRIISALQSLRPVNVTNLTTGEVSNTSEFDEQVLCLIRFVQSSVREYYQDSANQYDLHEKLLANPPRFAPAEWARQNGYLLPSRLGREVKAQSRIQKLYQHKLITEVSSYVFNPNPRKQSPSFSPKINLGAVDKQMASLSFENGILSLRFKAWHYEYLIDFMVPKYVLGRDIHKWSLPTIEVIKGKPCYIFSIEETPATRTNKPTQTAGLDLGRIEPYTLAITNQKGDRIAHYTTSGRVKQLAHKRERLLKEKSFILKKSNHYQALGLDNSILVREASYKAGKAHKLAQVIAQQVSADITKKLIKHDLNLLAVEDLSWVHGAKYGSKWNHSQTQRKLEHSLAREGVKTKKVNPRNTSQTCHKCGSHITHNTRKRTVHCSDCTLVLDRDLNASLNIAQQLIKNRVPNRQSRIGNNYSPTRQIIEKSRSVPKKPIMANMPITVT